jgi:hypothetical protein
MPIPRVTVDNVKLPRICELLLHLLHRLLQKLFPPVFTKIDYQKGLQIPERRLIHLPICGAKISSIPKA